MTRIPPFNRWKYLDNIRHDLDSITNLAKHRPDIFAKVVTDQQIEQLENIVTDIGAALDRELEIEAEIEAEYTAGRLGRD